VFPLPRNASLFLIAVAVMVPILCGGCGSGSSSSNSMSQAQAQAVTEQLSQAVAQALATAFESPTVKAGRPSLATVVGDIRPNASSGCTPDGTGENCNYPISDDGPCPGGGTIAVTGDIDFTLNGSGNGSVNSQLTISPANCSVSSLVINGDPSIDVGLQWSFADSALVYPIIFTEVGGISYGPNPSGSCQFNVTNTITSATSCTITGTACGQSVSGSC
jgi:hypothetical protein